MKQIRIGRSPSVLPGEWYAGQDWLPDRTDCYVDLELPLDSYRAQFGKKSHWIETREIADCLVHPEVLEHDKAIRAGLEPIVKDVNLTKLRTT